MLEDLRVTRLKTVNHIAAPARLVRWELGGGGVKNPPVRRYEAFSLITFGLIGLRMQIYLEFLNQAPFR